MLVNALTIFQVVAMAGLIVIGGLVEGYGYGLSLGTQWPYHRKMLTRAALSDPEIWHRSLATLLGLNAIVLLVLVPSSNTITGLVLIAATALLGIATLHVLAGKLPAILHGLHGLLAYTTYITYLVALRPAGPSVWHYLAGIAPLHPFLLMIFLGGMVTGQRGYQHPIGAFVLPRTKAQWVFALHYLVGLLFLFTLALYFHLYNGALVLTLVQFVIGFILYQSVNASPKRPGIMVAFHQTMALLILLAIVFFWRPLN